MALATQAVVRQALAGVLVSILLAAGGAHAQAIPQIPSIPFSTMGSYVEGELLPSFTFTPETDVTLSLDTCGTFLMSGNTGNAGILLLEIPSMGGKAPGPLTSPDTTGAAIAGISTFNQQQFCSQAQDPIGFDLVLLDVTLTANTQYLIMLSISVSLDYVFSITGPQTANVALAPVQASDPNSGLSASVKSDPHMLGFRGQSFDFTGQAGEMYCLIADSVLVVHSQFSAAYAPAGAALSEGSLMQATGGTWISSLGVQIPGSDFRLMVSVVESPIAGAGAGAPSSSAKALLRGAVELNGEALSTVGEYQAEADPDVKLEISNSKSFSRVALSSPSLVLDIDIVPPPAEWQVQEDDRDKYAHLNLAFHKVVLSQTAHGILGQTARLKLDAHGNAITESSGANGSGLIDGAPEDYVVSSLLSPAPPALFSLGG